ncbi:unnamed protein product, partial [Mesorhabditis belari]|uniref:DNA replication licensing factor MCM2 n=1 Tax=Mesorhabditis belari TaxID=2138241 RepID=A0AAF3EZF8_9BILA
MSSRREADSEDIFGDRSQASRNNGDNDDNDEVREEIFGDEPEIEEEDGEDLFGDDMMRDYREQPELDRFSESGLDDASDADEDDPSARRRAEEEMNRRDGAVDYGELLFGDIEEGERATRRQRDRGDEDEGEQMEDLEIPIDIIENMRSRSAKDHMSDEAVGREVERRFKNFLRSFKEPEEKKPKYVEAIKQLAADNKESLTVDYGDLAHDSGEQNIAYFLPEAPVQVIERLNKAATEVVLSMFPFYKNVCAEVKVRIRNLPIEEDIRMLRQIHLNMLVRTTGIVTQTTGILPQLSIVKYDCGSCGYLLGPFFQHQNEEVKPSICPSCQSKGPFELNMENTIYQNFQRIVIQESPNKVAAGRLPRSKDVVLLGDLCDSCKPGDEIDITGVYTNNYDGSLNNKQGFPVFTTLIHANHIYNRDKVEENPLTDEELKAIRELASDPRVAERVFASIAPSIYGHEDVKRAIALALFRGEAKNPGEKHRLRGDINVLLCGDPGCAKSQFLRYAQHVAPRAVLTTGQGASAVGLTAYVQRHPVTREWTLEAGAMVLADKGVCLIDEFDKMNDQDRTSIHEAMEQQSISISKAGIVTSLQARCTVIAASNPIGGRYDPTRTFAENVDLTEPILSRFDVLCVVRDIVDPVEDERLAQFVVGNHIRLHPANQGEEEEAEHEQEQTQIDRKTGLRLISQDLLRKYIVYAREHIHPKLNESHGQKLADLYAQVRKESIATGSVVITVRMVESMIRLSEAHAKIHLRSYVTDSDVQMAMRIMLESFINTQKASVMRQMQRNFSKHLTSNKSPTELLLYLLKQMAREQMCYESARAGGDGQMRTLKIPEAQFLEKARQLRIENVRQFYNSDQFAGNRFSYDEKRKVIEQAIF